MNRQRLSRRRVVVSGASSIVASSLIASCSESSRSTPNIVFILADDLGCADLGCYGREDVHTPYLDSLARDGMKFSNAYANSPTCSPTRIGLLTGMYQYRFAAGLEEPIGGDQNGLEPGVRTLPGLLKARGYQTSLVGKWHMGSPLKYSPLKHGYERFWGLRGGAVDYFTHDARYVGENGETWISHDLWDGDASVEETGYLTDLIGARAAREISRMSGGAAPFMLSVHFTAPHWPWETTHDVYTPAAPKDIMHVDGGSMAVYRSMVETLDQNVGVILRALKAAGAASNTIVVFTSDNGGERFSKNWPFNGMKGELLEGGIRTPLLVRWPGRVARGSLSNQVTISMDWVPTLLEFCGVQEGAHSFDGASISQALLYGEEQGRRLFWRHNAHDQAAIRDGQWKYLRIAGSEYLFDVVADPQERANRLAAFPHIFAGLKGAWEKWNGDMLPYSDANYSWDNKAIFHLPDRY